MGPETRFARVCLGWAPNCIHWQTFSSPPAWNHTVPYGSTRRPCQIQPLPCKPCSTPSPTMPCPPTPSASSMAVAACHPGCEQWVLDAYPPVLVLTSFCARWRRNRRATGRHRRRAGTARWERRHGPGRAAELGVPAAATSLCASQGRSETRLMAGEVPDPHIVTEAGARYRVHVLRGQNHGLFLDMAEGRRWVHAHYRRPSRSRTATASRCSTCLPTPAPFRWWRCRRGPGRWSTWT